MSLYRFIKRERLYILLLVFIIVVNAIMSVPNHARHKRPDSRAKVETGDAAKKSVLTPGLTQKDLEAILAKDKSTNIILSLASILIVAILMLGLIIDMMLVSSKMTKKSLDIATYKLKNVGWNISDVARVVILFLFFGYVTVIIEASLVRIFPLLKHDNLRMVVNTSMLDLLAAIFITYFAVRCYHEKIISLGLSVKNFLKNVFYGIVGYAAAAPVLVGTLFLVTYLVGIAKYVPEKQPIVELFLKEGNKPFLVYTSLFAAILGPFIEELFFRGFMYNAFKKRTGVFWATMITAAVFAGLHTNIVGFLPILVLGVLLTYLYEKTGTLVSPITVHIIHNLSMVFFVFLVKKIGVYG